MSSETDVFLLDKTEVILSPLVQRILLALYIVASFAVPFLL